MNRYLIDAVSAFDSHMSIYIIGAASIVHFGNIPKIDLFLQSIKSKVSHQNNQYYISDFQDLIPFCIGQEHQIDRQIIQM